MHATALTSKERMRLMYKVAVWELFCGLSTRCKYLVEVVHLNGYIAGSLSDFTKLVRTTAVRHNSWRAQERASF